MLLRLGLALAVLLLTGGAWWLLTVKPALRAVTAEAGPAMSMAAQAGIADAERRLGDRVPTGREVVMGHVEGEPGRYAPNQNADRFKGITFTARSGDSDVFGHAQATARIIYGRGGLAPGVTDVHLFHTRHWLTTGYLRAGQPKPPHDPGIDIFNHSWIAEPDRDAAVEVLRRVDHAIDAQDVVMCVGVNNGRASQVPALLASAYNVIAVGSGTGASSGGYTRLEGEGRCKPDIAGPRGLTSFTTPVVAACAARLLEAARTQTDSAELQEHSELVKALLMAGARKPWNWKPAEGKPLDEHLGAGIVDFDASLRILEAGRAAPETLAGPRGWDVRALEPERTVVYEFDTGDNAPPAISIMLVWHRDVDGRVGHDLLTGQPKWIDLAHLADFDLRLSYTAPNGQTGVIGESHSRIDNVEHIHLSEPPPGRYRLEVIRQPDERDTPFDYAVAWRAE